MTRGRRTAIALAVAALLPAGVPGHGLASAGAQSPVADLLDQYARGHRTLDPASLPVADEILKQLRRLAPGFLASADLGPEHARRDLVAFALEAAAVVFRTGDAAGTRDVIEWACPYVRGHVPGDEFDRRWDLASLALIEGTLSPNALDDHLLHVRQVFPNDPRVRLAAALSREQRTSPFVPHAVADRALTAAAAGNPALAAADRSRLAEQAITAFRDLLSDDRLSAEAGVRLAHLCLDLGRTDDARSWLAGVERETGDPDLLYLTHLFRGIALERLDRRADALAEYRAAIRIGPGAHAATMALAALLFQQDDRSEAESLVDRLLDADPPHPDPWWAYWMGDIRQLTQAVRAMREAIE
jgi:tetratricopeptide (TPR) repeat protein